MSTFAGLNTAFLGVTAQRRALDVVAQNVANLNTVGYTRQRVELSGVGSPATLGLFAGAPEPGRGVRVDGVTRLGDAYVDARVRGTASSHGFGAVRATALAALEESLREPGENGLAAKLDQFWASWSDLANRPGDPSAAIVVREAAASVAVAVNQGYAEVDAQWSRAREQADALVGELNGAAAAVAELNERIRSTAAAGGSVNELIDQRSNLTTTIAAIAGGEVRQREDGTVDVLVGGNPLVSGATHNPVVVAGAGRLADAATDPVRVAWAHRPGTSAGLGGGELAGTVSLLAPANGNGTGGVLAEAAASYNAFATDLAAKVNAVHAPGLTTDGVPAGNFFGLSAGAPAAAGLRVVATALATGAPGAGGQDGSVADTLAQIGSGSQAPDALWATFVTETGVRARGEAESAALAALAAGSALDLQLGTAGVDLDEETMNMMTFQRAYEGSARVMTAIDEMLDTLINRTGIVGR
ncbi:flagellar hook-associated protein FlgK [Occultella glacieicola]|uniref:Flagellar hook-associated protein 1 n=1 Tax=Occultella glacieicola TaxID=2518684 RepID=A0ABY2E3X9_9MICO|nr:flagellar hook-associated protein FlgK [Occultella glacieicola]TDE94743.1 flagellar hook-associated protein FlgK [Occultella glacieicola]